ncbi:MAG TPA: rhomboid family intramembrane serine protease [Chitinophagaceae bacterium]|jgi:membrane associated rhomboid family serine protease|nr:rhomboid family intramembrane serine protease [Chitinophagaceae bacterium]
MTDFRNYRADNFPPVVKNLIIVNVVVFIAQLGLDASFNLTYKLALHPVSSPEFRAYQVITHMFTHSPAGFMHILFNMFGLWMFGKLLENLWGPKRFLNFYLLCGIGAAIVHLIVESITGGSGWAVGASGAIMGIFAAFGYLFPNTELFIMFIPIPVKAKWAVLGLAAYDLFGGIAKSGGDNVAHFAHLGGALTGFIIVLIWNKKGRGRFY